ncbi:hypothetical protein [Piscinibacter terrae]|uniref:hypothetical protein n=1 Tax=Piscinibacter terrae TaxID=2496871 RepID=UPI000F5940C5|nr:hypothetical protein [Albitalea terrae]
MSDQLLSISTLLCLDYKQQLKPGPIVGFLEHPSILDTIDGQRAGVFSSNRHVEVFKTPNV